MAVERKRIYHKRNRLRQLRAFCQVARLSSITQAAESLGVSQPSVSIQVRELENELETGLFDRSGTGIALTRAGKRFVDLAEPLVQGMDELSVTLDASISGSFLRRFRPFRYSTLVTASVGTGSYVCAYTAPPAMLDSASAVAANTSFHFV